MGKDREALRLIEGIVRIARTTTIDNPELTAYMNAISIVIGNAFEHYDIIDDDIDD